MTSPEHAHVLILQPDGALSEVLTEVLQEHGLVVRTASSRTAPLAIGKVGLVLAELPGRSPQELRAFVADVAPTPVGLLTSDALAEDPGAAFVLRKPLDIDELLAFVATALRLPDAAPAQARLVERYFAALANNDWTALGELVDDNVVYNLPTEAPHGGIIVGRDAFLAYSAEVFGRYPDVAFTVRQQLPLPLSRVASYTGSWSTANGRVTLPGHVVFGFAGDKIARIGVHLDARKLQALRQIASQGS